MAEMLQSIVSLESDDSIFIPDCAAELKPYVGRKFDTLDDAESFYRDYGGLCSFNFRKWFIKRHGDGSIIRRYMVCSREGEKFMDGDNVDSKRTKRKCNSKRSSCLARIVFKSHPEGFVVDLFHETHTHPLLSSTHKQFMRYNRTMTSVHKNFVLSCARSNVCPVRSCRMFSELVGSYENIGCDGVDFKNFHRDLRICVEGAGTQMMLDKMKEARDRNPDLFYEYFTDRGDKLKRVFWADDICIDNYKIFGDSLSMDATYSTNSYGMNFVPFTGLDNHGKCITFAAGLLSSETVEFYSWLLNTFKTCMDGCPKLLITDQDPSVKIAMENVIPETRHHFCMWHIILKVSDKIPVSLRKNIDFTKIFNDIVWNSDLQPKHFDEKWKAILSDFNLIDHDWLDGMFDLRYYWIPTYFRDFPMSGLFRITSMSESENHFFQTYLKSKDNRLMFYLLYESAINAQRHTQDKLNAAKDGILPILITTLPLERNFAAVYSNTMFYKVQAEWVEAIAMCSIQKITDSGCEKMFGIDDNTVGVFSVTFNVVDFRVSCTCRKMEMHGLCCRHIWKVLKNSNINCVPDSCVLSRWDRNVSFKRFFKLSEVGNVGHSAADATKKLLDVVFKCAGLVAGNPARMNELLSDFDDLVNKYPIQDEGGASSKVNQNMFESFYGLHIPQDVEVLPPDQVKTKGSGSRIQSRKEAALRAKLKPQRMCWKCNQMGHHDSRNCPNVKDVEDSS